MIGSAAQGYFLDIFFLEKDIRLIQDQKLLQSIQTALWHAGLKIEEVVTRKEFMKATRSVPVNRYARLPNRFLAEYDERVFNKGAIESLTNDPGDQSTRKAPREVVKFDPNKPKEEQGGQLQGVKIEENVHFENAFFHNARYMSSMMSSYDKWTVLSVKYNYKLQKAVPKIADATAYTGIILTQIYNCDGIYTRAGSFARSEEMFFYAHAGKITNTEMGNDTCIGYLQPAKLTDMHGISARDVMSIMDDQAAVHYAAEDMVEIEKIKKQHFERYGADKSAIYQKLEYIMNDWYSRENRHPNSIVKLIVQMLKKETDLEEKIRGREDIKTDKDMDLEITRIATDITEVLVSRTTIKNLLYRESGIRDTYFKVGQA